MWFSGLKRTGKWVESSVSTILKLDALLTLMRIYKMEEGRENFMDRYFSDGSWKDKRTSATTTIKKEKVWQWN